MAASRSLLPDLDLSSYLRRGPEVGTFQDPRDRSVTNQDAWLALLDAIQAKDVAAIAERLPQAQGTVVPRTRTGKVRKGRLPHRVDALLDASPAFGAYQRTLARAYRRGDPDDDGALPDVPRWASAVALLHWAAPELVAPVILHAAAQDRQAPDERWWYHNPLSRWLTSGGDVIPAIEHGGSTGEGPWNPHWPAVAVALTVHALDRVGRDRCRDALDREAGRDVAPGGDNAALAWLQSRAGERLTREDVQALKERQRSFVHRIVEPADEDLPRAWDRALERVQQDAAEQAWDLPMWSAWARRWMLACDRLNFPEGVALTARAFWQRWPDARLPLRRDDSVSPTALLGQTTVFTDERLADWLVHGEGSMSRPARSHGSRWFLAEGYQDRLDRHPWTWLEWAVDLERLGVARRLAGAGFRLYEGFEAAYTPDTGATAWMPRTEAQTWPQRRAERVQRIDVVRITEEAYAAAPTPTARVRPRF